MPIHLFIKKEGRWFIDLPDYLLLGGDEADLEMVYGTDTMLDKYAHGDSQISLDIRTHLFEGSDMLILERTATVAEGGGAFYQMPFLQGRSVNQTIWLCNVIVFVFKEIPERIYVRKIDV